jgi:orotate phosphoribosyltransferase
MTKKKTYESLSISSSLYGWTGLTPSEFANRMKLASNRFRALRKELKFDAIAFCGSSGCAIAFTLAAKHKIPLIYVRKETERCHSNTKVECNGFGVQVKKYLIVDDFPDTGKTVQYIIDTISSQADKSCSYPAVPVGVLCFDSYMDKDRTMDIEGGCLTLFSVDIED